MGQAFDSEGNVLGEAEAATKREVFEQLNNRFREADRIEISTRRKSGVEGKDAMPTAPDRMLQFFLRYDHLPAHLQAVSQPFGSLAAHIVATVPSNPERTVALRKLLEAKDCAVRALLFEG